MNNTPRAARMATSALFFCNGFVFAAWGVHIPTIKDKFQLGEGPLALTMLSVALGAVIAMPRIGRISARFGSARSCAWSGVLLGATAAGILLMPGMPSLILLLLAFGAVMAMLDVAMNAQAALVETAYARPIMSSMHGLFSVGGMCGAASGALWQAAGGGAISHMLAVGAVVMLICLAARPRLLPDAAHASPHEDHVRHHASRQLRNLGLLAMLGLIAEGAMYDWSTVYMRDYTHANAALINAGYAAFSIGMAGGRFGGDAIRAQLGNIRILHGSAVLCVLGMLLSLLWPTPLCAIAGFTLVGLGTSNMMPVFFAVAANVPGQSASEAIADMARIAYLGLLFGPVLIGALAQALGLPLALSLIALSAALVGWRARQTLDAASSRPTQAVN